MPIDRPDGRHWCDPTSETPDEHGLWTCTCGQQWRKVSDQLWEHADLIPIDEPEPTTEQRATLVTTEEDSTDGR